MLFSYLHADLFFFFLQFEVVVFDPFHVKVSLINSAQASANDYTPLPPHKGDLAAQAGIP